jgi:diguanylate cyclase (GGDEF)-like protein
MATPRAWRFIGLSILMWTVGLGFLIVLPDPTSVNWATISVFAIFATIAESAHIRFPGSNVDVSCGDIFLVSAFIVLAPSDSVAMVGMLGLWRVIGVGKYWASAIMGAGPSTMSYAFVLWVVYEARRFIPEYDAAWMLALVVVGLLASRVAEAVVTFTGAFVATDGGVKERFRNGVVDVRDSFGMAQLVQSISDIPTITFCALLFHQRSWVAWLLFIPFASAWWGTRQTFKLVSAERMSRIDPLTGLFNRMAFTEAWAERSERHREGTVMSIIIGDVDNFKQINDTFGHLVGDDVLVRTAGAISQAASNADFTCRFGGEEFVVLAQRVTEFEVRRLADNIRLAVSDANNDPEVTISMGYAIGARGESLSEILGRADSALYAAKLGGKNCVVAASQVKAS